MITGLIAGGTKLLGGLSGFSGLVGQVGSLGGMFGSSKYDAGANSSSSLTTGNFSGNNSNNPESLIWVAILIGSVFFLFKKVFK